MNYNNIQWLLQGKNLYECSILLKLINLPSGLYKNQWMVNCCRQDLFDRLNNRSGLSLWQRQGFEGGVAVYICDTDTLKKAIVYIFLKKFVNFKINRFNGKKTHLETLKNLQKFDRNVSLKNYN